MNDDDVKMLRRACTEPNIQPFVDFRDEVLRALDEREALLTALKAFLPFADKRGACVAPQCLGSYLRLVEAYRDAQAVIAKAAL